MKPDTNTTHTPGPWIAVERQFASEVFILGPQVRVDDDEGAGRDTVAIIPLPSGCMWGPEHDDCTLDRPETDANARLIAAAPDMLATLRDIAKQWPESAAAKSARAALASATGAAK